MPTLSERYPHLTLPSESDLVIATAPDVVVEIRTGIKIVGRFFPHPEGKQVTIWSSDTTSAEIEQTEPDELAKEKASSNFLNDDGLVILVEMNEKPLWIGDHIPGAAIERRERIYARGALKMYLNLNDVARAQVRSNIDRVRKALDMKFKNL